MRMKRNLNIKLNLHLIIGHVNEREALHDPRLVGMILIPNVQ
jgi:hypothetical protein